MKKNIESKNSPGKNGMVEKIVFNFKFYRSWQYLKCLLCIS